MKTTPKKVRIYAWVTPTQKKLIKSAAKKLELSESVVVVLALKAYFGK